MCVYEYNVVVRFEFDFVVEVDSYCSNFDIKFFLGNVFVFFVLFINGVDGEFFILFSNLLLN